MAVASAPEQKPKSRFAVFLVLSLLVFGGGAIAWYFTQAQTAGKENNPAEEETRPVSSTPVFMTLETFTVNLQPDSAEQYLQTDISLQLGKSGQEELIKQYMPLVKAETLMILSSKESPDISNTEGKNSLSREIADKINQILSQAGKEPVVNGVFFTSFIIQ